MLTGQDYYNIDRRSTAILPQEPIWTDHIRVFQFVILQIKMYP